MKIVQIFRVIVYLSTLQARRERVRGVPNYCLPTTTAARAENIIIIIIITILMIIIAVKPRRCGNVKIFRLVIADCSPAFMMA